METNNIRLTPSRAIHPGEILREELLARGIKQKDFASTLGISASHLNDFLKGRRNLTEKFAGKLESAIGIPAKTWLRLHYYYLHDLKELANRMGKDQKSSISNVISEAIKRQGFSSKQIADIVGVAESEIYAYASGSKIPNVNTAGALCLALGIAPDAMLGL